MLVSEKISGIIEKGCQFEGNLTFTGVLRIAGDFTGNIYTNDTLIVNDTAVVQADVVAAVVIISGIFKGNITASARVEIKKPAKFEGTIKSPSLIVEEGVSFHGETKINDSI